MLFQAEIFLLRVDFRKHASKKKKKERKKEINGKKKQQKIKVE